MRFHNSTMEMSGSSARRTQQNRRAALRQSDTERGKRCTSLIMEYVDCNFVSMR
jgi:hypothetical protein